MKQILILFIIALSGCSTQLPPKPAPACEITVAGKCRDMSASEKSGAVVRGHGEEIKDIK